jgi:hypothetical protein
MARKVFSAKVPEDLARWVDDYASERGVSRSEILQAALRGLREDAKSGVPDLPAPEPPQPSRPGRTRVPGELSYVFGKPCRGAVHRWDVRDDDGRGIPGQSVCVDCGWRKRTREDFARATAERADLFARLRTPESVKRWGR